MSKQISELTFNELTKDLAYVKVIWNGKVIFDDQLDAWFPSDKEFYKFYGRKYVDSHFGLKGLEYIKEHYGEKHVYSMYMRVVDFHHCELYIEGE